jgi:hypothetical protein
MEENFNENVLEELLSLKRSIMERNRMFGICSWFKTRMGASAILFYPYQESPNESLYKVPSECENRFPLDFYFDT